MTNRSLAYLVRDQSPLIVAPETSVQRVCTQMCDRRAGSALVADEDGKLLAIFTGRDAIRCLAAGTNAAATAIVDAASKNPVTLSPADRAVDALACMARGNFRHVPIVDGGKILGAVSRGDFKGMEFEQFSWDRLHQRTGITADRCIADACAEQKPLVVDMSDSVQTACAAMLKCTCGSVLATDKKTDTLRGIFTGRDALHWLAQSPEGAALPLAHAMTYNPVTLTPDAKAFDALRLMSDGGFRHLPVVEDHKIIGIITRSDFTAIEIDRLDEEDHLAECIW